MLPASVIRVRSLGRNLCSAIPQVKSLNCWFAGAAAIAKHWTHSCRWSTPNCAA